MKAVDERSRRTRRKDKREKDPNESKDRKLSREKTLKRLSVAKTESESPKLAVADEDNEHDDRENDRGLTQEHILQLRALDIDDDLEPTSSFIDHRSADNACSTTYYVENEVSGEFFRVRYRRPNQKTLLTRSKTSLDRLSRRHGNVNEDDSSLIPWRQVRDLDAAMGIMGHGIVVGLSWMDAFNLGVTQDRFLKDEPSRMQFICTYSGVADRSRQLFFLLFNLSLLELMRKISRFRMQQPIDHEDPRLHQFRVHSMRLLQAAFVCTVLALLMLLIASPSTLRLSTAFAENPQWCNALIVDSTASSALSRLQQCAIANAVLMSVGWLFVCIQCNWGMSSHLALRHRLVEAHNTMDQFELRLDHLHGKALDKLSVETLKDLIQQHHHAVEVTESILVTKLQMQKSMSGQATSTWRNAT